MGFWTHFSHQTRLQPSTSSNPLVTGQTQIQTTAWHEKKIEGMLASITPGVIAVISRHEDLNSAIFEFLVPCNLWKKAGISCCALNPWGSFNWARSKPCGQKNVSESSDDMCTNFRVREIRPWKAGSQAQLQKCECQTNGSMQSISMEPAMSRHLFM